MMSETDRAKAAAFDRLRKEAEENRGEAYARFTWLTLTQWMDRFLADAAADQELQA